MKLTVWKRIDTRTTLTNVVGFTRIVDAAFNYFKAEKKAGQIAVISSIAGTKGLGVAASYSASKRY
ncbi:MAG: SDR family NAD(P)-dependent oxidoreductase, partial [Spirochaetaceae bacterium]|nr:SDR family NAD(P)-dependent oxidoreductase [Spirochaetaceae bacterium]